MWENRLPLSVHSLPSVTSHDKQSAHAQFTLLAPSSWLLATFFNTRFLGDPESSSG